MEKEEEKIKHTDTLQVHQYEYKRRFSSGEGSAKGEYAARASMTVEAALVLPFFLLILTGFLYWIPFMQLHMDMQLTLEEFSGKIAVYAYAEDRIRGGADSQEEEEARAIETLQNAGVQGAVYAVLMAEHADEMKAAGISGSIQTLYSGINRDEEIIDIVVGYQEQIRGFPLSIGSFPVLQRSRRRLWTGNSLISETVSDEDRLVYVTKNGSVYHTDPYCPYLSLSVVYRTMEEIGRVRNQGGEIYRPCERCRPSEEDYGAYITDYGNRFHNSAACPALRRNITRIPLHSVGGLPPCSKCNGGG